MFYPKSAFETYRVAFHPSILSRITPKNLTATQKMMMAKARIWNEVIGGNEKTGLRIARQRFKGPSMIRYFDYGIHEFLFPFEDKDPSEDTSAIDEFRALRISRKGKCITKVPNLPRHQVPRYQYKRYAFMESRRLERDEINNRK